MKVIAYTALHYGSDYLGWAIRSVIDHIDEYHVLYSAQGSHGSRTDLVCPDTRETLYTIAENAAGDKLNWHDGDWTQEGQQRDSIFEYAPAADVIVVLDADEIWPSGLIRMILSCPPPIGVDKYRLPMIHMWRSFWKGILHDPAYPVRIIYPKWEHGNGETITLSEVTVASFNGDYQEKTEPIVHLGYAQRPEIVQYKQHTHGHKGEWRKDVDWFNDVFMNNERTKDLHPVGSDYWNYELVYPLDYMPAFMVEHPYFTMATIE